MLIDTDAAAASASRAADRRRRRWRAPAFVILVRRHGARKRAGAPVVSGREQMLGATGEALERLRRARAGRACTASSWQVRARRPLRRGRARARHRACDGLDARRRAARRGHRRRLSMPYFVLGFVVLIVVLVLLRSSIRILREYERGVVFQLGRFWSVKGPGLIILIPVIQQMVRVDLRTRRVRRAAAGRDHARQRLGEGQRGGLLPRGRPAAGDHPGRELPRGHQPARADHAARGARQARARRAAGRAREAEHRHPAHPRRSRPTPGASRSRTSRSSTSTSTRPWSARSRARPRPSASGAPRSSTPKASCRPRRSCCRPPQMLAQQPEAMQLRYLQTLTHDRRRQDLDDRVSRCRWTSSGRCSREPRILLRACSRRTRARPQRCPQHPRA